MSEQTTFNLPKPLDEVSEEGEPLLKVNIRRDTPLNSLHWINSCNAVSYNLNHL